MHPLSFFSAVIASPVFAAAPIDGSLAALTEAQISAQDLAVQIEMAFWAECMFWATVVSLAVSVFALLGLMNSLRQTRASIVVTRDAAFLDHRPWLVVSAVEISYVSVGDWVENGSGSSFVHDPQGSRISIFGNFTVKNEGKTPAFGIKYTTTFANSDAPDPTPQVRSGPSYSGVLSAGMTERVTFMHDAGTKVGEESLGVPQLMFAITYRHYQRSDVLKTIMMSNVATERSEHERELNAASMLLSRSSVEEGVKAEAQNMYIIAME